MTLALSASAWSTIASLATALGTLVLAIATFASVRSANRSARIAEQALRDQRRALLMHSRTQDAAQRIMFGDGQWVSVPGGAGVALHRDGVVYLALSLRNIGSGIAVLTGWHACAAGAGGEREHAPLEQLRAQRRDLYIPPGDVGLWQGALRDAEEERHGEVARAISSQEPIRIELHYTDQAGAQRTVSRFALTPIQAADASDRARMKEGERDAAVVRHWQLEPR